MDQKLMESNLQKIESVISSRIVFGNENEIDEVHIVSNGHRGPKQIARDIQSVLLATYDVDVDHKKISIAQIPDDMLQRGTCRMKLNGVLQETFGTKATVKVSLAKQGKEYIHSQSGMNTVRNIERMLVESTLTAVQDACGYEDVFLLDDIRQVPISGFNVVVVCITGIIDSLEQRLSGSCVVKNDYHGAIVKATLDAVNRFVTK